MSYTKNINIQNIFQGTLIFNRKMLSHKIIDHCKFSNDYSIYGFNHIDTYKYFVSYKTKILESYILLEEAIKYIINHQNFIIKNLN